MCNHIRLPAKRLHSNLKRGNKQYHLPIFLFFSIYANVLQSFSPSFPFPLYSILYFRVFFFQLNDSFIKSHVTRKENEKDNYVYFSISGTTICWRFKTILFSRETFKFLLADVLKGFIRTRQLNM